MQTLRRKNVRFFRPFFENYDAAHEGANKSDNVKEVWTKNLSPKKSGPKGNSPVSSPSLQACMSQELSIFFKF